MLVKFNLLDLASGGNLGKFICMSLVIFYSLLTGSLLLPSFNLLPALLLVCVGWLLVQGA